MKGKKVILAILGTALMLFLLREIILSSKINRAAERIAFENNYKSETNFFQRNATYWIGRMDEALYVVPIYGNFLSGVFRGGHLFRIDSNGIKHISQVGNASGYYPIGILDRFFYYIITPGDMQMLCCINLDSLEKHVVFEADYFPVSCLTIKGNALVAAYYNEHRTKNEELHCLTIENGAASITDDEYNGIAIGQSYYYPRELDWTEGMDVFAVSESTDYEPALVSHFTNRFIISNDKLIVLGEYPNDNLLIIDQQGVHRDVFQIDNAVRIKSSAALHNNYLYYSFLRYEKYGTIGYVRYKDDTQAGTYRISLDDFSIEKLSDRVYDSLYIFDESGIYAGDEKGRIYKLDFDGNIMDVIL